MQYALSAHALERITERGLSADELAAALDGRPFRQANGNLAYRGSGTRVIVVVDPRERRVVTAFRSTRRQVKRCYSR